MSEMCKSEIICLETCMHWLNEYACYLVETNGPTSKLKALYFFLGHLKNTYPGLDPNIHAEEIRYFE